MHIYMDESGGFIIPPVRKPKISCVAALVLPSCKKEKIFDEFAKIRSSWGQGTGEVKGSKLNEPQVAEVISFLQEYDVLVEICAIDVGSHTEQQVKEFKRMQALKITENITPEHHPNLIKELHQLKDQCLNLPNQLFVQVFPMVLLIERLIETATLYYCQRIPQELGEFHWLIDAKDKNVTQFEKFWTTLMPAALQARALKQDFISLEGGDCSYFEKFRVPSDKIPDYLKSHLGDLNDASFSFVDFKAIINESFAFGHSHENVGLQLIDIIASAFARAMNGKLRKEGWEYLGTLIVRRNPQSVRMIALDTNPQLTGKVITTYSYSGFILEQIDKKTKSMFLK